MRYASFSLRRSSGQFPTSVLDFPYRVSADLCARGVSRGVRPRYGDTVENDSSLTHSAIQATVHCLTGCAIGEILGMVVATAFALANASSIALSVALSFAFAYALTVQPVMHAGVPLKRAL